MDPVRDNFLRSLSNYSECIKPYLRQVQDKYVAAYYIVEGDKVDLNAYCQKEREQATSAQAALEKQLAYWFKDGLAFESQADLNLGNRKRPSELKVLQLEI